MGCSDSHCSSRGIRRYPAWQIHGSEGRSSRPLIRRSIVPEVFVFVKENLSRAQRKKSAGYR
jgi:hypothetical protein